VLDDEELRGMSPLERHTLLRALTALEDRAPDGGTPPDGSMPPDDSMPPEGGPLPDSRLLPVSRPLPDSRLPYIGGPGSERRRAIALTIIIGCCVVLAVWTAVLALTLPRYYRAGGWRGAWVGFDFALLLAFAATGWAAWRRRQVLIVCLIVLATLLCCDAWFDVVLDAHTSGFELSLLSAVLIELPLAAFAILTARRLLRMTMGIIGAPGTPAGQLPRLRQVPLLGLGPADRLRDLLPESADGRAARAARNPPV
jgi:hypothetical protein